MPRTQSLIISYFGLHCVQLDFVLLSSALVDACRKQDSLMRGGLHDKRTSTLSAIDYLTVEIVNNSSPVVDTKARYWSSIAIFAYPICIRRPVRKVPVGILP